MQTHQTDDPVVIGAGGHGREIARVLHRATGAAPIGVHDDREPDHELLERAGVRWLGPVPEHHENAYVGIGNPATRRAVSEQLDAHPPAVVDPSAVIGSGVTLGAGTVVFPLSSVSTNVTLGTHSHIGPSATISHDCHIGDHVTVMPGAAIGGHVTIGNRTYVGANTSIEHCVSIGSDVTIRTGSVVLDDVPDGVTVAGCPARPVED